MNKNGNTKHIRNGKKSNTTFNIASALTKRCVRVGRTALFFALYGWVFAGQAVESTADLRFGMRKEPFIPAEQ